MLNYRGIYRFDGDSIRGRLEFEKQAPRPERLAELLAHP